MPVLKQLSPPSYKQGFARSAAESAYPGLWKSLAGIWAPILGVTGNQVHNMGSRQHGFQNADAFTSVDWVIGDEGYGLETNATTDHVDTPVLALPNWPSRVWSMLTWAFMPNTTDEAKSVFGYGDGDGTDGQWWLGQRTTWGATRNVQFSFDAFGFTPVIFAAAWPTAIGSHTFGLKKLTTSAVGTNNYHCVIDGVNPGNGSANANTLNAAANGRSYSPFGSVAQTNTKALTHYVHYLWMDRVLTDAEFLQLHIDPLAPLRRKSRFSLKAPAGGLGIPIAAFHYNHHLGTMA